MSKVTRTTRVSWFERLGGAFKGILAGLALVAACVVGLFWNEGRAVTTARSLVEGAGIVVSVPADRVEAANVGRLVHVSGPVTTDEILNDPGFAVSQQGVRLIRKVEMYQWRETSRSETRTLTGGAQETVTTYSYSQDWSAAAIDSSRFQETEGHVNPPMEIEGRTFELEEARLGAFTLGGEVLGRIGGARPLAVDPGAVDEIRAAYGGNKRVTVNDGRIHLGFNPERPAIGDYRVSYETVPLDVISVVARQTGDGFARYQTAAGDQLLLVVSGNVPAAEMFADAQSANTTMTWLLRALGLAALYAGFAMILRPLSVAADVLPFLGRIVRAGSGVVAFCLTLALGSVTIALAWFFYRPLLALAILAVGIVAAAAVFHLGRRKAAGASPETPETPAPA